MAQQKWYTTRGVRNAQGKWARSGTTSTKTQSRSTRSKNSRTHPTARSRQQTQVNGQSQMNTGSIVSSIRALESDRRVSLALTKSSHHSTADSNPITANSKSNSSTLQQTQSQSAPSYVTQQTLASPSQEPIEKSPMQPHMPSFVKLMTQAPRK